MIALQTRAGKSPQKSRVETKQADYGQYEPSLDKPALQMVFKKLFNITAYIANLHYSCQILSKLYHCWRRIVIFFPQSLQKERKLVLNDLQDKPPGSLMQNL